MTKREGAIITAFTGIMVTNSFSNLQEYADELFGYSTFTHQFGDKLFVEELKEKAKADFMNLCATQI